MDNAITVLAGATGNLGGRIARAILERGANVRAVVRHNSDPDKVEELRKRGAAIAEVDFNSVSEVTGACQGGSCVISALSGLREVIVEAQTLLLDAAVKAGVPRFIPSDYSIDFTKLPPGTNRNLDLRREFHERLDNAPIAATSILNGMFTDLLTGEAPFILFKLKRVVCWEDADQRLDLTTMDDTAEFTAAAALDSSTPRFLRIAGDQLSARGLVEVVSEVTGENLRHAVHAQHVQRTRETGATRQRPLSRYGMDNSAGCPCGTLIAVSQSRLTHTSLETSFHPKG
jgi:nucleoside-diphosphate-sugar epimerase